jgi:hypothetical protein
LKKLTTCPRVSSPRPASIAMILLDRDWTRRRTRRFPLLRLRHPRRRPGEQTRYLSFKVMAAKARLVLGMEQAKQPKTPCQSRRVVEYRVASRRLRLRECDQQWQWNGYIHHPERRRCAFILLPHGPESPRRYRPLPHDPSDVPTDGADQWQWLRVSLAPP